jgi:aerobic carbon-monoxide dehydrogenase medium subunit
VIPAEFAYDRAESVEHALELLAAHRESAKVLAGGQSLLPLMKLRLARPNRVIDIGRLADLRGVRELPDGRLAVGALTTYADLLHDDRVTSLALVADALSDIGDVQVRNRGTIGGAVAHADPAADMPAVLLALGAEVIARSAERGERVYPIEALLQGPFTTALGDDELLTEIRLPAPSGDHGSAYRALRQQASGFAIAGVAAVIGRTAGGGDGALDDVRIAVTGVGDTPYRAARAEQALRGTRADAAVIEAAVATVAEGVAVQRDIHADREYRSAMAAVMARRALEAARARLG